jgi:hypothetical protein
VRLSRTVIRLKYGLLLYSENWSAEKQKGAFGKIIPGVTARQRASFAMPSPTCRLIV